MLLYQYSNPCMKVFPSYHLTVFVLVCGHTKSQIDELKICSMSRFYVAYDNEDVSSSITSLHERIFFRIIWLSINGCSLTKSRLNSRFVQ